MTIVKPRPAVRAVDERIAVPAVGGVEAARAGSRRTSRRRAGSAPSRAGRRARRRSRSASRRSGSTRLDATAVDPCAAAAPRRRAPRRTRRRPRVPFDLDHARRRRRSARSPPARARAARRCTNGRKPTPCTTPRTRDAPRSTASARVTDAKRCTSPARARNVVAPSLVCGNAAGSGATLRMHGAGRTSCWARKGTVADLRTPDADTHVIGPRRARRARGRASRRRGYRVVGPTVRDGAIVYDEIASADELPHGWTDAPGGGDATGSSAATTRPLRLRGRPALVEALAAAVARPALAGAPAANGGAPEIEEEPPPDRPLALLGVRSCDLHAIAIQDRVFLERPLRRARLRRPPRGRLRRRRQLRRARRHVLLHLDGHGPAGARAASTSR